MPVHAGMILASEAANRVVKAMRGWLPARLGTDESGMVAAFMAFGIAWLAWRSYVRSCPAVRLPVAA